MARTDVEKKRKTAWPVVMGVVILVLAFWGITTLLTEDDDTEPEVTVPTVEDTQPPAAVPAPPDVDPEVTGTEASRSGDEVTPLGEEDVGQTVRLDGEVVATGNDAFWLLAGGEVLRVDSRRLVRKGDTVSIAGVLRPADPAKTDKVSEFLADHPRSSDWSLVREIKLVEDASAASDRLPRPEA